MVAAARRAVPRRKRARKLGQRMVRSLPFRNISLPGSLRYLEQDLPFCAVCGVTTGYAGQKQGLAGKLTAELIALDVAEGALVAGLCMFEQGYYDRLGFGTG